MHLQKNLGINFIASGIISKNFNSDNYNLILVMINKWTKMIHYKLEKIIIDIVS